MDRDRTRAQIEQMEGREHLAYPDPVTKAEPWTIGVGHTGPEVCRGLMWTDAQIDRQFDKDLDNAIAGVALREPWAMSMADARVAVLVNMAFQMGIFGLGKFVHMLSAAQNQDWQQAHDQMLDSTWARQTSERAQTLATQMLTGEWQS